MRQLAWGAALSLLLVSDSWAVLTHRYTFEPGTVSGTTFNDTVGTAHGTIAASTAGGASNGYVIAGQLVLPGGAGSATTIQGHGSLPGPTINLPSYTSATIEMWLTSQGAPANGGFAWTAAFGRPGDVTDVTTDPPEDPVGNDANEGIFGHDYLAVMPNAPGNASRVAITDDYFNSETGVTSTQVRGTGQRHLVVTVAPAAAPDTSTITFYRDGVLLNSATGADNLADISNAFAYIGRALYTNDPYFAGAINEFRIYNDAIPLSQVQSNFTTGPAGTAGPTITINRVSGDITLSHASANLNITNYSVFSPVGALDLVEWQSHPVAGRLDANPANFGTGDGSFDLDDLWSSGTVITSRTNLYEEMNVDGLGPDDGALLDSVSLGLGVWDKYFVEDVNANVRVRIDATTEIVMPMNIVYTGGPAYRRSDLNFDNAISGLDWQVFRTNLGTTLTPTLNDVQSYPFGDINGDQFVDFADFRAFQADYVAANGLAAFQAMLASVPEPASASLALLGLAALIRRRRIA